MSDDETPEMPGHSEVRALLAGGSGSQVSGIVRLLRNQFDVDPADAEDAVYKAIADFLAYVTKHGSVIDDPAAWLFVAAKRNLLKRVERQRARETTYDAAGGEVTYTDETFEHETYRYVCSLVQKWESGRSRAVTLLYLESEYFNEPLTQVDAAEQVSLLLGEDVPWTSIGKTRTRGFLRLRDQILDIARETGINPLDGSDFA